MIKKTLYKLTFLIIICNLFSYNSFAEGSCESGCKIKDGTPEIISEYIANNNKIISNISQNLGTAKKNKTLPTSVSTNGTSVSTRNKISSRTGLRIYNTLFNWSETYSGFQYFLANIDGDVPAPISRDLRLIDNQNKKLNYFLSKIIKGGYSGETFDIIKACKGVEDNGKCLKLLGHNTEDAIRNLIQNNNTINLIIRKELGFMGFKSVVGSSSYDELFAISKSFKQELQNNYNKETYKSCANCKGGSIERIKKMKSRIILNDKNSKSGINEWINAWNLLLGINNNKKEKNNELERKLLNEELAKQGISTKNGDAVLNDLKNFKGNSFGFSIGNNPITNSFENFIEQIEEPFESKQIKGLKQSISDINISNPDIETFTYKDIISSSDKLSENSIISKNIRFLVKQNMGIIARQNKNTDKLQARIIQLHINLGKSINTLESIIPKTEKICNQQDSGAGKCNYRN